MSEATPNPEPPAQGPALEVNAERGPDTTLGVAAAVSAGANLEPRLIPSMQRRSFALFWLGLAIGSLVYFVLLFVATGELHDFLYCGLEVVPLVGLAQLTYLGARSLWGKVLTLLYLGMMAILFMVLMTGLTIVGVATPENLAGLRKGEQLSADGILQVLAVLGGVGLVLLTSLLFYLPGVRRSLSKVLPIDPESFVHATALVVTVGYACACTVPLIVLGEPVILLILGQHQGDDLAEEWSRATTMLSELYSLAWLVPGVFLAVGYPWLRDLGQAAQRLGLVRLSLRQVGIACLAAVCFVLASAGVDALIGWAWEKLDWPTTDSKLFGELMKAFISPLGAIVIGVVAGLGEELVVRGLLQPRVGILLSNLFFTALHALQYNADALLSVFLFGLVLGLIRKYRNTTTSAIVHGMYDCLLILLTWAEVPGFQ